MDGRAALAALASVGLAAGRAEPIAGGWAFFTFDVDGRWIARFPRNTKSAEAAHRELALLPALAGHLPFAVPSPSHRGTYGGDPFFVYPRIPGRALHPDDASSPGLIASVGRMVGALHGFPVDRAAELLGVGAPGGSWRRHCEGLWPIVEAVALPALDAALADEVRRRFSAFLRGPLDFPVCLVHNDLGPEHVLVDEAMSRPTGIIDFESATVGDPAIDFVPLLATLGAGALAGLLGGRDLGHGLADRLWFYRWMGSVHAVIHGVSEDVDSERRAGMAELRRRLATPFVPGSEREGFRSSEL